LGKTWSYLAAPFEGEGKGKKTWRQIKEREKRDTSFFCRGGGIGKKKSERGKRCWLLNIQMGERVSVRARARRAKKGDSPMQKGGGGKKTNRRRDWRKKELDALAAY